MMSTKKTVGKFIVKSVMLIRICVSTLKYRLLLKFAWSIGKSSIFEGILYIPAVKGDVFIGNSVRFGPSVRIGATEGALISIGDNVSINQGSFIIARESIIIGHNTRVGEYVSIRDNDHEWRDNEILIMNQGFITKPVIIGEDVWIGRNVVIGKGVKIGNGAVIGANAVITKDVKEYEVVVGNPGRVIKTRGN